MELITDNIGTEDEWAIPSTIKAHLQYANLTTRWPCGICAGETDKTDILVTFYLHGDEYFICDQCLDDGPAAINDRLRATAEYFERVAKRYRDLADADPVWDLPSGFEVRRFGREAHEAEIALLERGLATFDAAPVDTSTPF